jgi:hydroxymethylbilane synthase
LNQKKFIIGTRGSELALWQSKWVKDNLEIHFPGINLEIKIIKTTGDKIIDVSLSKIGDKGLFTKEIELSLLDNSIDMAVHSLKDLPTELPEGLMIGAVSERMEQRDVFVSNEYKTLDEVPAGAKIGTGSLRRRTQLLNFRPDLNIKDLRGNITTRIKKYEESEWAGIILAFAGLKRLGLEKYIKQIIPTGIILPSVSQGVMAVEVRKEDKEVFEVLKKINNETSEIEIKAERSFLRTLQGGCQVPIGVYSKIQGDILEIEGMVGSLDGKVVLRDKISGNKNSAEQIGIKLAEKLFEKGALEILEIIRNTEGVQN